MPATNMYACHSSASLCFSLPLCVTSYMRLHAMCPLTTSRTIARTRTRTRTRIRTHAHMQCKVCVWSCITLSLAVVCWEMLMDSDSMPTCALWRRSKLIHVAQPTTEIHSLHAQFCHSLRKYQVCLGWGGGGGGRGRGTGGMHSYLRTQPRAHLHGCMLGTSSKVICRHRPSGKDCFAIYPRLQWHQGYDLPGNPPAQRSRQVPHRVLRE